MTKVKVEELGWFMYIVYNVAAWMMVIGSIVVFTPICVIIWMWDWINGRESY